MTIGKFIRYFFFLLSARQIAQVSGSAGVSGWAGVVHAGSEDGSGSEWAAEVVGVAGVAGWAGLVHAWSSAVTRLASAAVVVGGAEESLSAKSTKTSSNSWSTRASSSKGAGAGSRAAAVVDALGGQRVHLALVVVGA